MEHADFKSWPGISSRGVFARHGFPFNLLISVLVSMATLFSACFRTFMRGNQRLWIDVHLKNYVFSVAFLTAWLIYH